MTKPRAHVVDLLRIVMSVQMIQGHVIDALLDRALRGGDAFAAWTWARGLTAVGFMVAAGMSFHLSSLARWDAYRADRAARRRRMRRALLLIGIGYALHAPAGVLSGDAEVARAALEEAQIVDVLQCIGVTMLALEAMVAIASRARQVVVASVILAVLAIGLAPIAASLDCPASGVRALCNYASRSGGSLFPLLPWSGFVLGGVAIGALALPEGARTPGLRSAGRLAIAGTLVLGLGLALGRVAPGPSDPLLHSAWPAVSLVRLGCVILLAAALAAATHRLRALPAPVRTLAGETLVLYVSHLLVLYVAGIGLARVLGPTLRLGPAVAIAVVIVAGCASLALSWARLRERREARAAA